jgi:hypothetical protein
VYHVVKQVLSFSPSWEVENLRSWTLVWEQKFWKHVAGPPKSLWIGAKESGIA